MIHTDGRPTIASPFAGPMPWQCRCETMSGVRRIRKAQDGNLNRCSTCGTNNPSAPPVTLGGACCGDPGDCGACGF